MMNFLSSAPEVTTKDAWGLSVKVTVANAGEKTIAPSDDSLTAWLPVARGCPELQTRRAARACREWQHHLLIGSAAENA